LRAAVRRRQTTTRQPATASAILGRHDSDVANETGCTARRRDAVLRFRLDSLGPAEGARLTSQGHPRTVFRRALQRGNLLVAELTAREVGHI
jgi:hypothetical protein